MIGFGPHAGVARRLPLVLAIALLGWFGCGESDGEAQLEAASREFSEARATVADARAAVEEQGAAVHAAQEELQQRRAALREAEARLAEVEKRIDLRATDTVLFRSIQKRLLEDDDLEGFAIAARVEKGVVVLSGRVSRPELRNRAVEIARATPGVASVESRIEVLAGEGKD